MSQNKTEETGVSGKSKYHHGNLREALLNKAFEILDESGVDAVTIRMVAREVGVAHSAPANHFSDKKSLLTVMATRIFQSLHDRILTDLQAVPDNQRSRLIALSETLVAFGLNFPNRYRLLWRKDSLDHSDQEFTTVMESVYGELLRILGDMSKHHQNKQHPVSTESRAIALWSMMHGYISMRLDGNFVAKSDDLTGQPRHIAIIEAILEGIG